MLRTLQNQARWHQLSAAHPAVFMTLTRARSLLYGHGAPITSKTSLCCCTNSSIIVRVTRTSIVKPPKNALPITSRRIGWQNVAFRSTSTGSQWLLLQAVPRGISTHHGNLELYYVCKAPLLCTAICSIAISDKYGPKQQSRRSGRNRRVFPV